MKKPPAAQPALFPTPPPRYCSLDLELSGFDPTRDTILEVGFTFFTLEPDGLKIGEQYSQVFRPNQEVHPKILGLTGITHAELGSAPPLDDHREFLNDTLKDAILVGHNIIVDIRFLQASGIQVSDQSIDTLDLVQFLLPTHHSYNLENLMHFFNIPHPEAHRALADSMATIKVLEQLLGIYQGLPPEVKQQVLGLAQRGEFTWLPLFETESKITATAPVKEAKSDKEGYPPAAGDVRAMPGKKIILQSFANDSIEQILPAISATGQISLLVISEKLKVLELWRQGQTRAIFVPDDLFSERKFRQFLESQNLTPDEIKFALKIIIWQATNWQHYTIIDLNLSFFGGQFRAHISGGSWDKDFPDQLVCCDYATFLSATRHKAYLNRALVIHNMHGFAQELASGRERRISWSHALYIIKSLDDVDLSEADKALMADTLAATDLFFGLVVLLLERHFAETYVTVEQLAGQDHVYGKITKAAANYVSRLQRLQERFNVPEVSGLINYLETFFVSAPEQIKWLEAHEDNVLFFNQPLHIEKTARQALQPFAVITLTETFPEPLVNYFMKRLGLDLPIEAAGFLAEPGQVPAPVPATLLAESPLAKWEEYLGLKNLPAVVVMPNPAEIKEFYNNHYRELKEHATIYAQGYSGGSNKMFRNFAIRDASILLATDQMMLRNSHRQLAMKTLLITELPRENLNHPYVKALYQYWQAEFPNIAELLDSFLLLSVLRMAYTDRLEHVYLHVDENSGNDFLKDVLKQLVTFRLES